MSRNILKEILSADDDYIRNTFESMNQKQFKEFCYNAMLQQDRDTRHACSYAILESREDKVFNEALNEAYREAHHIVVNCGDGIK